MIKLFPGRSVSFSPYRKSSAGQNDGNTTRGLGTVHWQLQTWSFSLLVEKAEGGVHLEHVTVINNSLIGLNSLGRRSLDHQSATHTHVQSDWGHVMRVRWLTGVRRPALHTPSWRWCERGAEPASPADAFWDWVCCGCIQRRPSCLL